MKKLSMIILLVIISGFIICGCSSEKSESTEIENTTFDLVSDRDTGIIYIKNHTYPSHHVYTPYYSKNGKLCRYDDGRIVEVE